MQKLSNGNNRFSLMEEGVWRVLGPVLISVAILGGGGWLAYVQSQISEINRGLHANRSTTSDIKERLRGVEVGLAALEKSLVEVAGNARESHHATLRILSILRENGKGDLGDVVRK